MIPLFLFFYFRKRVRTSRGRAEGKKENLKQGPHSAWSRRGSNSQTVRWWPELRSRVGRLTNWAPQAPHFFLIFKKCLFKFLLVNIQYNISFRRTIHDLFLMFIFQRERVSRVQAQREGDRGSQSGSVLTIRSLIPGSNSQTLSSWPELKSRARCLTHWATQASLNDTFFKSRET